MVAHLLECALRPVQSLDPLTGDGRAVGGKSTTSDLVPEKHPVRLPSDPSSLSFPQRLHLRPSPCLDPSPSSLPFVNLLLVLTQIFSSTLDAFRCVACLDVLCNVPLFSIMRWMTNHKCSLDMISVVMTRLLRSRLCDVAAVSRAVISGAGETTL